MATKRKPTRKIPPYPAIAPRAKGATQQPKQQQQPMPAMGNGSQVLQEPAFIVGQSGQVYGTLGENAPAEPEMLSVLPLARPYNPQQEQGTQQYLTGGELFALGYDPNDPNIQNAIRTGQIKGNTTAGQVTSQYKPTFTNDPMVFAPVQGQQQPQGNAYTNAMPQITAPQYAGSGGLLPANNNPNVFPQGGVPQWQQMPAQQPQQQQLSNDQMRPVTALNTKFNYLQQQNAGFYDPQTQTDLGEFFTALQSSIMTGELSPDQAAVLYEQIELASRQAGQPAMPQQPQQPGVTTPMPQQQRASGITPPAFTGGAGMASITPPRLAGGAGLPYPTQGGNATGNAMPYPGMIKPPNTGEANMLSPDGRSIEEIKASGKYNSPNERLWYLNSIGKSLDANGNIVPFSQQPQPTQTPELTSASAPITVEDVNHGGTAVLQPDALKAIMDNFPQSEWKAATMIMASESKGNPLAIGGVGERGLFQINPGPNRAYWNEYSQILGTPINEITLQDANLNARVARLIWDRNNGWARKRADGSYEPNPWSTAPAVLKYLGR